ncbi:MAG: UDP-N-acetylmuramate:L-alanyl-gamma-D-glutamyl-meso-diaminopimelate ligase [Gemmatimonadaceae bacterium]|nr:UDP-N-acetylmuramate:L-alanyl-gamma-D-glutamyl-meso-diaminopimelate ligase [Gemmatimonadaceae bacterium]
MTLKASGKTLHYHLIGIAGTAMASLAGLLKQAGHRVTGSDENVYPPMSDELQSMGIEYAIGYKPENLDSSPDVVVVGNAISRGNAELESALERKLYYTSAAATIKEEFIRGKHSIAVAGTHGKTSTTSLLAWTLECAGKNPSFLIGGVAENFGKSYRLTDSDLFVIEADEYDTAYFDKGPKMWHYLPDTAIVNNIEFDHADIYRDEEAYNFAFARFINLIPGNGQLIAGWDSPLVRSLAAKSFAPVQYFSYDGEAPLEEGKGWTASNVSFGEDGTRFTVIRDGMEWGVLQMPMTGAFSVRNALAVIAAATAVGAEHAGISEAFRSYKSVKRRMEVRGEAGGVLVIDDFAHHPTAVRETMAAIRQKYAGRRVIAIFEPRSYTAQRREFQKDYEQALSSADEIVFGGLFHPERYTKETAIDPHALVGSWRAAGIAAEHIADPDEIVEYLRPRLKARDVVLVMTNGGFGGIHGKLLKALSN